MKLKNAITLSAIALATMLGTTDLYEQQKKAVKNLIMANPLR